MAITDNSASAPSRNRVLILLLSLLLSLGICVAVFFVSSSRPLQHSYLPLILGVSSMAGLLTLLNKFVLPKRVWSGGVPAVLLISLLEAIPFVYVFMFLLLNSFGE